MAQPSLPTLQPSFTPFAHRPQTTEPVSVVIPSFARPGNLHHQLVWLLQLEPLHRRRSEVIVSHGSQRSWDERDAIDRATAEGCAAARRSCAGALVRHVNSTALNARVFTAHRFFAAAQSGNEVLLHLDDDLVPGEAMLVALVDAVALEPGFPAAPRPGLYGPSGFGRACGPAGYQRGQGADPSAAAVITNLAAASKALNRRYLDAFEDSFGPLLHGTRGNGEDLTYSHVAQRSGGVRRALGTCDAEGSQRDACAVATGEFAYLSRAINPKDGAAFHYGVFGVFFEVGSQPSPFLARHPPGLRDDPCARAVQMRGGAALKHGAFSAGQRGDRGV